MKLRMMAKKSTLYQAASKDSGVVAELNEGDEVELRRVDKKKKDDPWVEVETAKGEKGFLSGKTRMNLVKRVKLLNPSADIYTAMSEQSEKIGQFRKGDVLWMFEWPIIDGVQWYRVRKAGGPEGYLTSAAKFKDAEENPRGIFIRTIFSSAILFVIVIVLLFVNANSASDPWIPLLALAAIVFGTVRIIFSLLKYLRSR